MTVEERLERMEARLAHLEMWMQRSLNEGTVYPLMSELHALCEAVVDEVEALEARL